MSNTGKYFGNKDLGCRCGCGLNNSHTKLIAKLDQTREIVNRPIILNRACSCKDHNKAIGGSNTSSHLNGWAADIRVNNSKERFELLTALITVGFHRIGIANGFIHVDIDEHKTPNVVWRY